MLTGILVPGMPPTLGSLGLLARRNWQEDSVPPRQGLWAPVPPCGTVLTFWITPFSKEPEEAVLFKMLMLYLRKSLANRLLAVSLNRIGKGEAALAVADAGAFSSSLGLFDCFSCMFQSPVLGAGPMGHVLKDWLAEHKMFQQRVRWDAEIFPTPEQLVWHSQAACQDDCFSLTPFT